MMSAYISMELGPQRGTNLVQVPFYIITVTGNHASEINFCIEEIFRINIPTKHISLSLVTHLSDPQIFPAMSYRIPGPDPVVNHLPLAQGRYAPTQLQSLPRLQNKTALMDVVCQRLVRPLPQLLRQRVVFRDLIQLGRQNPNRLV